MYYLGPSRPTSSAETNQTFTRRAQYVHFPSPQRKDILINMPIYYLFIHLKLQLVELYFKDMFILVIFLNTAEKKAKSFPPPTASQRICNFIAAEHVYVH